MFGAIGSIGIGSGVGGFSAYLGLGVLDTLNHRGNCCSHFEDYLYMDVRNHPLACVRMHSNAWSLGHRPGAGSRD